MNAEQCGSCGATKETVHHSEHWFPGRGWGEAGGVIIKSPVSVFSLYLVFHFNIQQPGVLIAA